MTAQPLLDLSIAEVLGKNSAILHSDGLTIFQKLNEINKREIIVSFKDITHCTTAFLNASIGKFIIDNRAGNRQISFVEASEDILAKIKLVQDNASNEKKRTSLDNSAHGFLYA